MIMKIKTGRLFDETRHQEIDETRRKQNNAMEVLLKELKALLKSNKLNLAFYGAKMKNARDHLSQGLNLIPPESSNFTESENPVSFRVKIERAKLHAGLLPKTRLALDDEVPMLVLFNHPGVKSEEIGLKKERMIGLIPLQPKHHANLEKILEKVREFVSTRPSKI